MRSSSTRRATNYAPKTRTRRRVFFFTLAAAATASLFCCTVVVPTYRNLNVLLRQDNGRRALNSISFMEHGMPLIMTQPLPLHPQEQTHPQPQPFHVLFGLLGRSDDKTADALYRTWQVALKSVLLNAPTDDRPLNIHVLCNSHAQHAVHTIIQQQHLMHSQWRNPVKIQTYNVEALHASWKTFLQRHLNTTQLDERVSLGGYYRLLAHQVLNLKRRAALDNNHERNNDATNTSSPSLKPVKKITSILYMDSDVVILSNLNDLIPYIETDVHYDINQNSNTNSTTIIFQGSKSWFCSGFVLLNLPAFDTHFWNLLDSINQPIPSVGDQAIMTWILEHFPENVADLPPQWQRNLAHGWRQRLHILLNQAEAAGMVHFQGGTARKPGETYFDNSNWMAQYCQRAPRCNKNWKENIVKLEQTWGAGILLHQYAMEVGGVFWTSHDWSQ